MLELSSESRRVKEERNSLLSKNVVSNGGGSVDPTSLSGNSRSSGSERLGKTRVGVPSVRGSDLVEGSGEDGSFSRDRIVDSEGPDVVGLDGGCITNDSEAKKKKKERRSAGRERRRVYARETTRKETRVRERTYEQESFPS